MRKSRKKNKESAGRQGARPTFFLSAPPCSPLLFFPPLPPPQTRRRDGQHEKDSLGRWAPNPTTTGPWEKRKRARAQCNVVFQRKKKKGKETDSPFWSGCVPTDVCRECGCMRKRTPEIMHPETLGRVRAGRCTQNTRTVRGGGGKRPARRRPVGHGYVGARATRPSVCTKKKKEK